MTKLKLIVLGLALALSVALALTQASPSAAVRLVRARVMLDGEVILVASTSDDGSPDLDEVWGYLEDEKRLTFLPTEAFEESGLQPKDDSLLIRGESRKDESRLKRPIESVALQVAYGGRRELRELKLIPATSRDGTPGWRVTPDFAEKHFDYRLVRREAVRRLDDVDRKGAR